jgi:hypothetical protein
MIEAPNKNYLLEAGLIKAIYLDRQAASRGEPCWMVYVAATDTVYRAREFSTKNMEGLNVRGTGHRDKPLRSEGPAYWIETSAQIEVIFNETPTSKPRRKARLRKSEGAVS